MIPFLTCVHFPLNFVRGTMAPGFKCNTSTYHRGEKKLAEMGKSISF